MEDQDHLFAGLICAGSQRGCLWLRRAPVVSGYAARPQTARRLPAAIPCAR
jgi:hypothetical protein